MKKQKSSIKNKIKADIDDGIYALVLRVQKKYGLSWREARDSVNHSLRVLMLSYPDKWLKK